MLMSAEYMVFGDIPVNAVIHNMPLANLIALYDHDKASHELLNLHAFRSGDSDLRTTDVASRFRERNVTINARYAAALGRVAAIMLGPSLKASLGHIGELVQRCVYSL
jgi:hypothetical protein